jgi:hypothetical protein
MRDGTIVRLAALSGYTGALLDVIGTGMTHAEVASSFEISWLEEVVGRVIAGVDGVWLGFERDDFDWSEEELAGRKLESIAVFLPSGTDSGRIGL